MTEKQKSPKLSKSLQEKLDHIEFIKQTTEFNEFQSRNKIKQLLTTNDIFTIEFDKELKKHTFYDIKNRDDNLEPIQAKITDNSINQLIRTLVRLDLANIVKKDFTDRRGRTVEYYEIHPSNELSYVFYKNSSIDKQKQHNINLVNYLNFYNGERDGQIKFVLPVNTIEYDQVNEEEL